MYVSICGVEGRNPVAYPVALHGRAPEGGHSETRALGILHRHQLERCISYPPPSGCYQAVLACANLHNVSLQGLLSPVQGVLQSARWMRRRHIDWAGECACAAGLQMVHPTPKLDLARATNLDGTWSTNYLLVTSVSSEYRKRLQRRPS